MLNSTKHDIATAHKSLKLKNEEFALKLSDVLFVPLINDKCQQMFALYHL